VVKPQPKGWGFFVPDQISCTCNTFVDKSSELSRLFLVERSLTKHVPEVPDVLLVLIYSLTKSLSTNVMSCGSGADLQLVCRPMFQPVRPPSEVLSTNVYDLAQQGPLQFI
jgi:hypothetical protein